MRRRAPMAMVRQKELLDLQRPLRAVKGICAITPPRAAIATVVSVSKPSKRAGLIRAGRKSAVLEWSWETSENACFHLVSTSTPFNQRNDVPAHFRSLFSRLFCRLCYVIGFIAIFRNQ
jgi:hypothetical protein